MARRLSGAAVSITTLASLTLQASAQDGQEALVCAARMTALAAVMEIGGDRALRDRVLREAERNFERALVTTPGKNEATLRRELRSLVTVAARHYRDGANVAANLRRCAKR